MRPLYAPDLALVHHLGFGSHGDACAPGILTRLEPVLARDGLVLELGCGSGALTRHLVAAGHRVVATDASPAMVELTREAVPGVEGVDQLVLPDDPLPPADAVVSVGHVLNYLPDRASIDRALAAAARSIRPGGLLALDLLDLRYAAARGDAAPFARVEDGWALFTRYEVPRPDRFVRNITTFVPVDEHRGGWRRHDERHENVLLETSQVPALLAEHQVEAMVRASFGEEALPDGLVAVIGKKVGRPGLEPGPEA